MTEMVFISNNQEYTASANKKILYIECLTPTLFKKLTPDISFTQTKLEGTNLKLFSDTGSQCFYFDPSTRFQGRWTAIQLHSGSCIAYVGV